MYPISYCIYMFCGLSLGPGEVSVWQKQDLLQGWSGCLPGEAAFWQAAYGLCPHPEDYPLLAGPQKVPEDEGICSNHSETCTGPPGALVSGGVKQQKNKFIGARNFSNIFPTFFYVSYFQFLRRTRAAVVIQQTVRMWVARRRYQRQRCAAVIIQCFLRAYMARMLFSQVMCYLIRIWRTLWIKWVRITHLKGPFYWEVLRFKKNKKMLLTNSRRQYQHLF